MPERPGRLRPTTPQSVDATRPELSDPELFPPAKSTNQEEDDHNYVFCYEDGGKPPSTVTRLFRYEVAVHVIDLNLKPGTRAHQAASKGFYFDTYSNRLYLRRPT